MDIGKSITFVNEDERWLGKLIVAVALTFFAFLLVPIPLLAGYSVAIARNVKNGEKSPLPEWDDFGKLFMDGLYIMIAQFVYTLPFWIIACIGFTATIGFGGLTEVSEEIAATGIVATLGVMGCLFLLLFVALMFVTPAIFLQYVHTEEFGACFRFGEVVGIVRDYIGDIVITVVVALAASFVISAVGGVLSVIPCIGWIAALVISALSGPWITFSISHLYGQIAAKMNGKMVEGLT